MLSLDKMRDADLMPAKGTKDYLLYLEHQMTELEKARKEREQRKKLLFESEILELRLQAIEQECFYPETVLGDKRVMINTVPPSTSDTTGKPKEKPNTPKQEYRPPLVNLIPPRKEQSTKSKEQQLQENQDQLFDVVQSLWAGPRDIEDVLNKPGVHVNAKTTDGLTPIHLAVIRKTSADKEDVIRLLDQHGVNLNATTSKDTNTPLHLAVRTNDKIATKTLVELGANRQAKNKHEETPLDLAIRLDHTEVADILEGRTQYDNNNAGRPNNQKKPPPKGTKDKPKPGNNNPNGGTSSSNRPSNTNNSNRHPDEQKKTKSCTIL